jgi:DNA-binding transcriptional LysR family regulator
MCRFCQASVDAQCHCRFACHRGTLPAHAHVAPDRGHSRHPCHRHGRRRSPPAERFEPRNQPSDDARRVDRRAAPVQPREAAAIFSQINDVYDKVEDLLFVISRMARGTGAELKRGSVPSIGQVMMPRAIADVRRAFPSLLIDVDILKIEEAIDYLLLGKGEVVVVSHMVDYPMLSFEPPVRGKLKCIVSDGHELSGRSQVSVSDIAKYKLIGIDPNDPYGRIMANLCGAQSLSYDVTIRARFGSTVCALVAAGLGIAVIDEFDCGCPYDGGNPAITSRPRFGGGQQAALTFVEMRRQRHETIANRSGVDHSPKIPATPMPENRTFRSTSNRVAYFRAGP